jgi:hypothetical protein
MRFIAKFKQKKNNNNNIITTTTIFFFVSLASYIGTVQN